MYDSAPIDFQRSRGSAAVALSGQGRLLRLHQQGCAKAFLPRTHTPEPEIVFLNTAGGVTGGDSLSYSVELGEGARVTATSQTAERGYRAHPDSGAGHISFHATVAAGAELHWLPQECILFDGADLVRRTRIDLAQDATLLFCEMLVLGRLAMGERLARISLSDQRAVFRLGKPVYLEPLEIQTRHLGAFSAGAGLGDATALASIVLISPRAEDLLSPVRKVIGDTPAAAASAWDGKLVFRAMSTDNFKLRRLVAAVLIALRGAPLPRVWQV